MFPDLKSRSLLGDLISLPFGFAILSKVEQTCCDIPIIDSRSNLIYLYHISPETTIWQRWVQLITQIGSLINKATTTSVAFFQHAQRRFSIVWHSTCRASWSRYQWCGWCCKWMWTSGWDGMAEGVDRLSPTLVGHGIQTSWAPFVVESNQRLKN